jgi:MFS family permease
LNPTASNKIYTTQFWLTCLSSLLFFASFNMIIPELPAYLTELGGAEYKGLIISLFTLTAMISRPFSGKLADKFGRKPVMMFGALVCFVCGFIYPILSSVGAFLFLRLVHGFSTGFTPTGQTAFLADIIPANRRGEAMGLLGTAGSVGMAGGPAIGGVIANHFSLEVLFYCSSVFAITSILILLNVKETLKDRHALSFSLLRIQRQDLLEPKVMKACFVMGLSAYLYGTLYTVIPDFGEWVGIRNKGLLFTYLTVASLLMRLIAGRASDRFGRVAVLKVSMSIMLLAGLVIGFAEIKWQLQVGIILYGVANGMTSPTLFAWATDLSDENHKGRGLASLYIFMELGIGVGALFSGFIYANDISRFPLTFGVGSVLCTFALIYLFSLRTKKTVTV